MARLLAHFQDRIHEADKTKMEEREPESENRNDDLYVGSDARHSDRADSELNNCDHNQNQPKHLPVREIDAEVWEASPK
jgi:hypothetical protein